MSDIGEMMPGKRFGLFALAVLTGFAGLSTYCYGDADCGFDSNCPGVMPPCYKLVVSGCTACPKSSPPYVNGTWWLEYNTDVHLWCEWCTAIPGQGDFWFIELRPLGTYKTEVWHYNGYQYYYTSKAQVITGSNVATMTYECDEGEPGYGYIGAVASWEPSWDCNACDKCVGDLTVIDSNDYKDPIYYGNLDCCPPGEKGESTNIIYDCNDADYVVPIVTIEESHPNEPNAPDEWIEVTDSNLVWVTPTECFEGNEVTFRIQALTGHPPSKARVTVNAAFFTEGGEMASGTEKTVMVLPQACACAGGGGGGGGCSGGICALAPPGGLPGPSFKGP